MSNSSPSIAVVVLDTLRKDAFDRHFEWLPGRRFENAWAPSHWTVPVHASLFCGRYPSELGVHAKHQTLDCPESTLAEVLKPAGYTTRAFSSNVNVSEAFAFDRGFDAFDGSWRLTGVQENVFDWASFIAAHAGDGPGRYLKALRECVFGEYATVPSLKRGALIKLQDLGYEPHTDSGGQETVEFVRSTDFGDREFLFLNLMEAHAPYTPPVEYRTVDVDDLQAATSTNGLLDAIRGGPDDPDLLRQAYDDSVAYLSDVYRDLFEDLQREFDVVVTLSDHGESFGEYGAWKHAYGVFPELTHVPLVVSGRNSAGEQFEGSTDRPTSLLDVHATVLDLAGLDTGESAGVPLDEPPAEIIATESHGLYEQHRIKAERAGVDPSSYDREFVGATADSTYGFEAPSGFETVAIRDDCRPSAETLRKRVDAHRERCNSRALSGGDDISDAVLRQLEDLGYA